MYKFSNTSLERLNSCDINIQRVMDLAISRSDIDFGIAQGYRSVKEQQDLYAQGRTVPGDIVTYVDGVNKKSNHNYYPSKAVDIYAWVDGRAIWDSRELCYLAGVIISCAKELGVNLRWGANWDSDGIIITDHDFVDLPHFELDE